MSKSFFKTMFGDIIYIPAVLLNEAEFVKRTDTQKQLSPDCYILALHNRCVG